MSTHADLLTELNGLMRLTAIEADIARSRSLQARDEEVRDELLQNARNADTRRLALHQAVRELGGVPDVLGVALDRMVTLARTQVLDQTMPINEALLADLALEHQLRDRSAFARVIAEALDETDTASMLERVGAAHVAAIEWIEARLGEVALGGPAALRPTPLQSTAAIAQRVATLPSQALAAGINRGVAVADGIGNRLGERLGRTRDAAEITAEATAEGLAAGRETMLRTAERRAADEGAGDAVRSLRQARRDVGALSADELPIQRYGNMNADRAIARIEKLDDPGDVRTVRNFEAQHKNRSSVLRALDERFSELAGEAMS